jgi:hypothetical protein
VAGAGRRRGGAGAVNTGSSLKTQYSYADGSSSSNQIRPATLVYPNGRTISYDYGTANGIDDVISRVANLKESATTYAGYSYLGTGTIVRIDYPAPQVRLDLWGGTSGSFAGLDRFGRTIDQRWYDYGASPDRDRFKYGYERAG